MIYERIFLDMPWFWVSKRYLNASVAKAVFERVQRQAQRAEGRYDAGFYRHGTYDSGMVYITGVSHRRDGLEALEPLLLGEDFEQDFERMIEPLIRRRVRVLGELIETNAPSGHHRIFHGDPQRMTRGGVMEDDD